MIVTCKNGMTFKVKKGTRVRFLHNQIAFVSEADEIVFLTFAGVENIEP